MMMRFSHSHLTASLAVGHRHRKQLASEDGCLVVSRSEAGALRSRSILVGGRDLILFDGLWIVREITDGCGIVA